MPQLAGDSEPPAMHLDDRFADRQPHAGSVDLHALVSSSVEFFKNKGLFKIVDAGPAVGNAGSDHLLLRLRGNADGSAARRVFGGVLDTGHHASLVVTGINARV